MSETIFRIQKNADNPFVMIDKNVFEDTSLSFKAKGILGYLLSRPNDWTLIIADIQKRSTDGKDSVKNGIDELIERGYIVKTEQPRQAGKFATCDYVVYEKPINTDVNRCGKTVTDKPLRINRCGKSATTNNNDLNNKEYKEKEKAQPQNSDGFIVGDIPQQPTHEVTEKMIDDAIAYLVMQKLLNPFELFNRDAIRFELINSQQYKKPVNITLANFIKSLPVDERIARFQTLAQSEIIHPSHIASAHVVDDTPKLSREEKLARIAQIERGEI